MLIVFHGAYEASRLLHSSVTNQKGVLRKLYFIPTGRKSINCMRDKPQLHLSKSILCPLLYIYPSICSTEDYVPKNYIGYYVHCRTFSATLFFFIQVKRADSAVPLSCDIIQVGNTATKANRPHLPIYITLVS